MSGIPGSRVGGIGPTDVEHVVHPAAGRVWVFERPVEQPHHAACRQRTPEEDAGHRAAVARRKAAAVDLMGPLRESIRLARHRRTCTDPTCFCDWSQP